MPTVGAMELALNAREFLDMVASGGEIVMVERAGSKVDHLMTKGLAGEPGFEPGLTESESVGLPLTYSPTGPGGWEPELRGRAAGTAAL